MTRYIVVGAGALGALLAAQLYQASIPTVLVARGSNLDQIRGNGVTVHRPHLTDVLRVPVVGGPDEVVLTPDDVLVLATKTQDVEQALQDWSWREVAGGGLAVDLPIVTLHNGLAAEDAALRRFPAVYGASMWIAAGYLTPGEVISPAWPVVGIAWVGALGEGTEAVAESIAHDFTRAGYLGRAVPDIRSVKAHKLLGNLANALDLFSGTEAELADAKEQIVAEASAAYAAAGIVPVDPSAGTDIGFGSLKLQPVAGQPPLKRSTWQSFARGASSEVDFLNGEIVLLGRLYGVPTPLNERVQRVLGALATTGGGAEPRDINEVLPVRVGSS
jgi:2-dehydropantoate 2-reductase